MNKKPKRYKYKLKIDDSFMSELAIDLGINTPAPDMMPDMINPESMVNPDIVTLDMVNPDAMDISEGVGISESVDREIGLKLSTKLQNVIDHVGDKLYVLLEKARNDGEYMEIKTISGALDHVYDLLKFVNYKEISQIDYSLLEIMRIAEEFKVEIPENLQYETIYKVDVVLNDAMDYEEDQKKADYEAGLEKVVTKSTITKDKLPTIRDNFWEGVDNISKLLDKLKEIQDVGNHRFDKLIKDLENFNTDEKSDAYIKKLVYNLILRLKFM